MYPSSPIVEYMITKKANTEQLNEDMLPVKGDIPRDASTQDLLELIRSGIYISSTSLNFYTDRCSSYK